MLIIHLLLVGMLVSAGDPNKGPSQKQQTFPWIKYSHHQDLYTGKHCLLSQLPLISHYHDAYMTCILESIVQYNIVTETDIQTLLSSIQVI